jgi:hypothetical protein
MSDILQRLSAALADRYLLEREIGAGGMATVYLARDLRHKRSVAVKVIRPELAGRDGVDRFLREIEVVAGLQHPHILPVFDSGVLEDDVGAPVPYFVMPYVEGETLRQRLERDVHPVGGEVLARRVEARLGPSQVMVDGQEAYGLVTGQIEKRERLERARDFPTTTIGDQHAVAGSRLTGYDHHRARAFAEHLAEGGIGLILRLELEVSLSANHNHITSGCLGDNLLVRCADVLQDGASHPSHVAALMEVLE